MRAQFRALLVLVAAAIAVSAFVSTAGASLQSPVFTIGPPWCGTPTPDAAGSLPTTGTGFAHIPYYAIKCTLDGIAAQSNGRITVEQIGVSAQGRPLYSVVVNALDTASQQRDFANWQKLRSYALENPVKAQKAVLEYGPKVKAPIFFQANIHGDETEGTDASLQLIKDLATTPYGVDPDVDTILDHLIVVFNVTQNPDGRVAGTRANGNGFDLNRDYITQSQPEVWASVALMQKWLPVDFVDQHGYSTPTLIELKTKPHNPTDEYDLVLKWDQARGDAQEAALNAIGMQVQRPINDWCPNGSLPPASGVCAGGIQPGPAVAEGWDDWGPFYAPMYMTKIGLNAGTNEMCSSTTFAGCGGRAGARREQYTAAVSAALFHVPNRSEELYDEFEHYRRAAAGAARFPCCLAPFDVNNNWQTEFPRAYIIPFGGGGQRSDPEANRLVDWLLDNNITVSTLKSDYTYAGTTYPKDSYVIWMNQSFRSLAETALGVGSDISAQIGQLYAPPAAWSHGYLWGADVVTVPTSATFAPATQPAKKLNWLSGGVENGHAPGEKSSAEGYALEIDSATAVRALNALLRSGVTGHLALHSFPTLTAGTFAAGSVIFPSAARAALAASGQANGLWFKRVSLAAVPLPTLQAITRVPRVVALTGSVSQATWVLNNLGFQPTLVSTATINTAAADPLADADVIFNSGAYPAAGNTTGRARLQAFFARGGGYVGTGTNGAAFLTTGAQVTGLTAATRSGSGRSGIINWENNGGVDSPIVGTYPARDTTIVDPPIWFTALPATFSTDARLPITNLLASGFWLTSDAQSASAAGSALIAHGTNTTGTARLTVFGPDPTYRADPEREWPALSSAFYWATQPALPATTP